MKKNLFLIIFFILFLLIFISLNLVSCYPVTFNGNTATESTTTENTASTIISETTATEIETVFNISIANGSGSSGLAKKIAELFKTIKYSSGEHKYSITHITNADNYNYKNTQIICKSDDLINIKAAEDIKTILEVGIITTSNKISKDTDIAIIIGKDYSPPSALTTAKTTATTTEQYSSNQEISNEELFNNIEVTIEVQDIINGKQKIVVWIKNNNKNHTFSGTMHFEAISINDDILCSDSTFIEDVPPGFETWAILWGKPGFYDSYSTTVRDAIFREAAVASNVDYEEIGIKGFYVFIYTTETSKDGLLQIVNVYKNDRFKSKDLLFIEFYSDRNDAVYVFKNGWIDFEIFPIATYSYNINTGLDEFEFWD